MRSVARHLVRRVPLAPTAAKQTPFARPAFAGAQRTYYSVRDKIQNYHDELLGCNWGDYLELVQNVPFYEAELERIQVFADPYLNDAQIGPELDYVLMATDAMYGCECVRSHVDELLELMTRKTGIMGLGINAGEAIENLDEQAEIVANQYAKLLEKYPQMKPKIEQSVGHGMAILRMKHKFKHPMGHRFFY